MLGEERGDRHDEAGRAEAALQAVAVAERGLHGRELTGRGEAFDGRDVVARRLHREQEAGPHGGAVEQHGARAAHAVLAAEMGAGEPAVFAEEVGEGLALRPRRGGARR